MSLRRHLHQRHGGTNPSPACGDDAVKFKVSVQKGMLQIPPPSPGKAAVVLIENMNKHGVMGAAASTRFGIDGAWVGANKGNSYFVVEVDPGAHQVCANWQAESAIGNRVGVIAINAVAGQTYYFEAAILEVAVNTGPPGAPGRVGTQENFNFVRLNQQQAQNRLQMSGLSNFTSK